MMADEDGLEPWPEFMIIGAAKCGTTSLYHYLRTHPQIFLPAVKEPGFFSAEKKVLRTSVG